MDVGRPAALQPTMTATGGFQPQQAAIRDAAPVPPPSPPIDPFANLRALLDELRAMLEAWRGGPAPGPGMPPPGPGRPRIPGPVPVPIPLPDPGIRRLPGIPRMFTAHPTVRPGETVGHVFSKDDGPNGSVRVAHVVGASNSLAQAQRAAQAWSRMNGGAPVALVRTVDHGPVPPGGGAADAALGAHPRHPHGGGTWNVVALDPPLSPEQPVDIGPDKLGAATITHLITDELARTIRQHPVGPPLPPPGPGLPPGPPVTPPPTGVEHLLQAPPTLTPGKRPMATTRGEAPGDPGTPVRVRQVIGASHDREQALRAAQEYSRIHGGMPVAIVASTTIPPAHGSELVPHLDVPSGPGGPLPPKASTTYHVVVLSPRVTPGDHLTLPVDKWGSQLVHHRLTHIVDQDTVAPARAPWDRPPVLPDMPEKVPDYPWLLKPGVAVGSILRDAFTGGETKEEVRVGEVHHSSLREQDAAAVARRLAEKTGGTYAVVAVEDPRLGEPTMEMRHVRTVFQVVSLTPDVAVGDASSISQGGEGSTRILQLVGPDGSERLAARIDHFPMPVWPDPIPHPMPLPSPPLASGEEAPEYLRSPAFSGAAAVHNDARDN